MNFFRDGLVQGASVKELSRLANRSFRTLETEGGGGRTERIFMTGDERMQNVTADPKKASES